MQYVKIPLNNVVNRMTIDTNKYSPEVRTKKLRQLLYRTGLRTKDVAAILDYQPQTVRVWASVKTRPIPYHALKRLFVMLGYDLETVTPKTVPEGKRRYADVAG